MRPTLPIHPYLFALFPAWFLYTSNLGELSLGEVIPSMLVLLGVAVAGVWIGRIVLGSADRSALVVAGSLVFLFIYEAVHRPLWDSGFALGRHRYLLPLFALGIATLVLVATRLKRESLAVVNRILGGVAITLIAVSFASVVPQLLQRVLHPASSLTADSQTLLAPVEDPPNIYYIVLDGYARHDILASRYGDDDGAFLDRLRALGFFVATESRANYGQTVLSLASSLNLRYLDDLAEAPGPDSNDRRPLSRLIKKNRAADLLRSAGYRLVSYSTGYEPTELRGADLFNSSGRALSLLEHQLLSMTPLTLVTHRIAAWGGYGKHRRRVLFTLDHLPAASAVPGPKFVFAHIMVPHQPFVLNSAGEPIEPGYAYSVWNPDWVRRNPKAYRRGYVGQARFVATEVGRIVAEILAADANAVIMVQSDHGPALGLDPEDPDNTDLDERMAILSAYHLPGDLNQALYPSISPVNTFRIVFNQYFGTDYAVLPDRSFFSSWSRPYHFLEVPADGAS